MYIQAVRLVGQLLLILTVPAVTSRHATTLCPAVNRAASTIPAVSASTCWWIRPTPSAGSTQYLTRTTSITNYQNQVQHNMCWTGVWVSHYKLMTLLRGHCLNGICMIPRLPFLSQQAIYECYSVCDATKRMSLKFRRIFRKPTIYNEQ